MTASSSELCPIFVGRDEELRLLHEHRRAAARRHPSIVIIRGEAGIGKSRLLREFRAGVSLRHTRVAIGNCPEHVQAPFSPFFQILQSLSPVDAEHFRSRAFANETTTKIEIFAALLSVFAQLAKRRTTIALIEDIHWADKATLDFLMYLSKNLGNLRCLFVATYRPEAVEGNVEFPQSIARLGADHYSAESLVLRPLSDCDMQTLITSTLKGHTTVATEVSRRIRRYAEGNPFVAEELIGSAITAAQRGQNDAQLPPSINFAVLEKFTRLTPAQREILNHAAVLGQQFSVDVLYTVANSSRATVLKALSRAKTLQLLTPPAARASVFSFRHALTRHVIIAQLPHSEQKALHGNVTRIFDTMSLGERQARLSEMAYHYFKAGFKEAATLYNTQAGDAAYAVHAYEDAITFYERALQSTTEADDLARLWRKKGDAHFRNGSAQGAKSAYAQALKHYASSKNNAEAAELYKQLARSAYNSGGSGQAIQVVREALKNLNLGAADPYNDWFHAALGFYHVNQSDAAAAFEALAQVRASYLCQDADLAMLYHSAKSSAFALLKDKSGWLGEIQRVAEAGERGANPAQLIGYLGSIGVTATSLGDGKVAELYFERCLRLADSLGLQLYRAAFSANYAFEKYLRGDLRRARDLIEFVLSIPSDMPSVETCTALAGLCIGSALDDRALISRCIEVKALPTARDAPMDGIPTELAGPFSDYLMNQGDLAAAQTVLSTALRPFVKTASGFLTLVAAAKYGDRETVERAKSVAVESSDGDPIMQATLHLIEAWQAKRQNDEMRARSQALLAANCYRNIGFLPPAAEAFEIAGELPVALQLFREMSHVSGMLRIKRHLTDGSSLDHVQENRSGALSAREWEIARLVAGGNSNKVIARELQISEKTVEKHMACIFHKLQLSSRVQIAAEFARRTLPI